MHDLNMQSYVEEDQTQGEEGQQTIPKSDPFLLSPCVNFSIKIGPVNEKLGL